MYAKYSEVSCTGPHPFAEWRPIILEKKQPRKMFVQANTRLQGYHFIKILIHSIRYYFCLTILGLYFSKGQDVKLVEYQATHDGLLQSWNDRFEGDSTIYQALQDLWVKDRPFFC